ncbi:hypothetical protein L210DRAFT_949336 [Boletus edulis BED1]|uniref:Uncharacterized protein n=1 Tax=Boletus edulis BED1 TaxID=1328754 RepID=A0AAD4GHW8_BOLED|nr:hypothetical protein L210DRAFT_949336 [Boletus edulis BED1]
MSVGNVEHIPRRRTVHPTLCAISESPTPYFHRRWLGNGHWADVRDVLHLQTVENVQLLSTV